MFPQYRPQSEEEWAAFTATLQEAQAAAVAAARLPLSDGVLAAETQHFRAMCDAELPGTPLHTRLSDAISRLTLADGDVAPAFAAAWQQHDTQGLGALPVPAVRRIVAAALKTPGAPAEEERRGEAAARLRGSGSEAVWHFVGRGRPGHAAQCSVLDAAATVAWALGAPLQGATVTPAHAATFAE